MPYFSANNLNCENFSIDFWDPSGDINPLASFTANSSEIFQNEEISFTDTSQKGNGELAYEWDFGDGTVSDLQTPVHRFELVGTFNVNLTEAYT